MGWSWCEGTAGSIDLKFANFGQIWFFPCKQLPLRKCRLSDSSFSCATPQGGLCLYLGVRRCQGGRMGVPDLHIHVVLTSGLHGNVAIWGPRHSDGTRERWGDRHWPLHPPRKLQCFPALWAPIHQGEWCPVSSRSYHIAQLTAHNPRNWVWARKMEDNLSADIHELIWPKLPENLEKNIGLSFQGAWSSTTSKGGKNQYMSYINIQIALSWL